MSVGLDALNAFIGEWKDTEERAKAAFVRLKSRLEGLDGVSLDFVSRSGVTYSLRAVHENQKERALFVMVDVIEDKPRWLSICTYSDMVGDPEEQGDHVPEGLLGEDAVCFDIDEYNDNLLVYVESRLDEAYQKASMS